MAKNKETTEDFIVTHDYNFIKAYDYLQSCLCCELEDLEILLELFSSCEDPQYIERANRVIASCKSVITFLEGSLKENVKN